MTSVIHTRAMEKRKNLKIKDPEIILAAQEIKFAKILAGNDKKLRDKTLRRLQKWLNYRSQSSLEFSEGDFMRLWKGLFYCMWMSDKLLPQEECAEMIAKLIHSLNKPVLGVMFLDCFLKTMINEWFGIDQLRLNKFLMLVRRVLRQSLIFIRKCKWDINLVKKFAASLTETVLSHTSVVPLGLSLHFIEIYLEELAKVMNQKLTAEMLTEFVRPFGKQIGLLKDGRVSSHIANHIFRYLLKQSDEGIEFQEKFKAWHSRGFPGGNIDALQKVEDSENEDEIGDNTWEIDDLNEDDAPKDPRAGKVDVVLRQLKFNPEEIVKILMSYKFDKQSVTKSRKIVNKVIEEYNQFMQGDFPLGIKSVHVPTEEDFEETNVHSAAENLIQFEADLIDPKLTKSEKKKLKRQNQLDGNENDNFIGEDPLLTATTVDTNLKTKKRKNPEESHHLESNKKIKSKSNEEAKFVASSEEGLFKNAKKAKKVKDSESKNNDIIKEKTTTKNVENACSSYKGMDGLGTVWEVTEWKAANSKEVPKKETTSKFKTKMKKTKLIKRKLKVNENDSWEKPLEDGETEIFIPAKKYQKKLTLEAKKQNKSVADLLEQVNEQILQKKKAASMPILVTNPFSPKSKIKRNIGSIVSAKPKAKILRSASVTSTRAARGADCKTEKKVRIELSLNKSQNNREYQKQVLSSPGIPYDAKKQPVKPLLKKNIISSPVDPFYNLNDSLRF